MENHPVIGRLVEYRAYLEKSRPLDAKLRYQVEKLLRMANEDGVRNLAVGASGEDSIEDEAARAKPHPDNMATRDDEHNEHGPEEEDGAAVYKAPKLAAVHYEEDSKALAKEKKSRDAHLKRAQRSALVESLRQELTGAPEELKNIGWTKDMDDRKTQERLAYEEEYLTRLSLSKKERNRLKRLQSELPNELKDLDNFTDMAFLKSSTRRSAMESAQESLYDRKAKALEEFKQAEKQKAEEERMRRKRAREIEEEELMAEGAEMFGDVAEEKQLQKKAKKESYIRPAPRALPEAEVDEGQKRKATSKIIKNRGLVAHRKKENKNPRVKLRNKFSKALSKRKSVLGGDVDKAKPFQGATTGINPKLSKSTKF